MAAKSKIVASKKSTEDDASTHVTRVKAVDKSPSKKVSAKVEKTKNVTEGTSLTKVATPRKNFFLALGAYFKGAWQELRLVRWPDRKATWGLTVAVLLFTAFFVVLIIALDAAFKFLFQQILG